MFLIISIITGFLVALMIQVNGVLQDSIGGVNSLLSIHLAGIAGALLMFMVLRKRMKGRSDAGTPFYYLCAGMVGILIVYFSSVSFLKGGILVALSGSLAGQTLTAAVVESFYPPERKRSSTVQRVLSPALLLPGSVIIGIKAGIAPGWILFSWLPGILLMIQQSMNAGNTARWGTPKTVVFNYISALLIIIPLFLIKRGSAAPIPFFVPELSAWVYILGGLIGVYTTGAIAFLLLKAPALMVILGIYAGELAGGMILDIAAGNPVAVEKVIGIALLALGLAGGKIEFRGSVKSEG